MKVEVRKARPMDAEHGAICLHCDKCRDGAHMARRCRAEWLRHRMAKGLDLFVAYVKDRPVGFIEGEPMDMAGWDATDLYWLRCMYVELEFRGHGLGEQLLNAMEVDVAHRSRGLCARAKVGDFDLGRLLTKHQYRAYDLEGQKLYGKLFHGAAITIRPKPKQPPRNRPEPDDHTVLVEHYWTAGCAREAYDSFVLQMTCARFGSRVRLHSVCQDEDKLVEKFGSPPGYVFVDGVEPANLYKSGAEDPDAVKQAIWHVLRLKRLT